MKTSQNVLALIVLFAATAARAGGEPLPAFGPGTVITLAVEHGDAAGHDYEFIATVRKHNEFDGFVYDWSMGKPKDWHGSRAVLPNDMKNAKVVNDYYTNGQTGPKRGMSAMLLSQQLFDALSQTSKTTIDIVNDGRHVFSMTSRSRVSIPVNGVARDLPAVLVRDDRGRTSVLLDSPVFALWLEFTGKFHSSVVSIQTPEAAFDEGRLLASGRLVSYGVHFDTDSASLLPESASTLDAVARFLVANSAARMRIEGHTDGVGTDPHNLELSRARAESVKRYLVEKGTDGGRLETVGYGKSKPIADNASLQGRAKNRRVVFEVVQR